MGTPPAGPAPSRYNHGVRKAGPPSVAVTLVGAAVLVLAVSLVDFGTGTELRVFPLYFLPILAVSLRMAYGFGLGWPW